MEKLGCLDSVERWKEIREVLRSVIFLYKSSTYNID